MAIEITTLRNSYQEARKAADAALDALWADPKSKEKNEEHARLFKIEGDARRALEAATKKSATLYDLPDQRVLQAEKEMDAIRDADA